MASKMVHVLRIVLIFDFAVHCCETLVTCDVDGNNDK